MRKMEHLSRIPRPLRIVLITVFGVLAACAFALLFGLFVMLLWNWLMPGLFSLPSITYLQAAGIVLLARMIFGFGSDRHGPSEERKEKCEDEDWYGGGHWHDYRTKYGNKGWRHYDAWWKQEGKSSFEEYISRMDENTKDDDANTPQNS